jgi:hypothetical protein
MGRQSNAAPFLSAGETRGEKKACANKEKQFI